MSVLTNARIYHDGFRFDTDLRELNASHGVAEVEDTVLGDSTESSEGGLRQVELSWVGYYSSGDNSIEDVTFNDVGVSDVPITYSPNTATDGDDAYISKYQFSSFEPFGQAIGESHQIAGAAIGREDPLVRGQYLHNAQVTSTGSGSGVQVGSVSASQNLYAILHVTASSGDSSQTLDVTIESDSADSFSGAETTRVTFSQVTTTVGGQWATPVSGAITDDWWRTTHTVGGTGSPTFTYVVAIGILAP